MKKIFIFAVALAIAMPMFIKAKTSDADNEVAITINGATISPSDPNFYSFLQLAAAQAMAKMNQRPDENAWEPEQKKRGKKSRRQKNNEENARFITTLGALVSGIAQTAMTGNPTPAIMGTFNAVATMINN